MGNFSPARPRWIGVEQIVSRHCFCETGPPTFLCEEKGWQGFRSVHGIDGCRLHWIQALYEKAYWTCNWLRRSTASYGSHVEKLSVKVLGWNFLYRVLAQHIYTWSSKSIVGVCASGFRKGSLPGTVPVKESLWSCSQRWFMNGVVTLSNCGKVEAEFLPFKGQDPYHTNVGAFSRSPDWVLSSGILT